MNKKPLAKNIEKRDRKKRLALAYYRLHRLALLNGWDAPPIASTPKAKYWHYWIAKRKSTQARATQ